MARVLVTGMSGAGKTTLLEELARRGFHTVDTDYDGWTLADGSWDAARMAALLEQRSDVIASGTVDNQVDFYDRFGHVVLLSVPLEVAIDRMSSRTNNRTAGLWLSGPSASGGRVGRARRGSGAVAISRIGAKYPELRCFPCA